MSLEYKQINLNQIHKKKQIVKFYIKITTAQMQRNNVYVICFNIVEW